MFTGLGRLPHGADQRSASPRGVALGHEPGEVQMMFDFASGLTKAWSKSAL